MSKHDAPSHFQGKSAAQHVAEAQAQGVIDAHEVHGTEAPGHIAAFADAARDTFIVTLLLFVSVPTLSLGTACSFLLAWSVWKGGRSGWIAWARLERLHRVLNEEKWEIEHHRQQERDELTALYEAKGFQGKLLEDVIDVLMADSDRLLKVMIEEELGLSLESQEHPLKPTLGAFSGAFLASLLSVLAFFFVGFLGFMILAILGVGASAALYAFLSRNHLIPAIVWNIALLALTLGIITFL